MAALLHDVMEDTEVKAELAERFGKTVAGAGRRGIKLDRSSSNRSPTRRRKT